MFIQVSVIVILVDEFCELVVIKCIGFDVANITFLMFFQMLIYPLDLFTQLDVLEIDILNIDFELFTLWELALHVVKSICDFLELVVLVNKVAEDNLLVIYGPTYWTKFTFKLLF